ncbi:MAG: phosphatase PAP2 family protein [Patescibacteria group bacterium]
MISDILNSDILLACLVLAPVVMAIIRKKTKTATTTIAIYLSAFIVGSTIKKATAIPRPFIYQPQILGLSSNIPQDFSFPSLHTMLATIFAWTLASVAPQLSWLGFGVNMVVALSRVLLGVHYYTDIFFGFIFATLIYWAGFFLINPGEIIKPHSNIKRKLVHFIFGAGLVVLLKYQLITALQIVPIFLGLGLVMFFVNHPKFKIFRQAIVHFERSKDPQFPGLGLFWYLLSSLTVLLFFEKNIALAAIINLAAGDSINALTGFFYNRPKQKLVGPNCAAFFASMLLVMNFVGPLRALTGVLTASILEFIGPRIKGEKVDDNIWIPIVSAMAMSLVA